MHVNISLNGMKMAGCWASTENWMRNCCDVRQMNWWVSSEWVIEWMNCWNWMETKRFSLKIDMHDISIDTVISKHIIHLTLFLSTRYHHHHHQFSLLSLKCALYISFHLNWNTDKSINQSISEQVGIDTTDFASIWWNEPLKVSFAR